VDEGGLAEFRCKIEANPFDENTVKWDMPDRPEDDGPVGPGHHWRDRIDISVINQTSILRLRGIDKSDTGLVVCTTSNGVKGVIKTASTNLVVNRKSQ
jgi:hypothetical protein